MRWLVCIVAITACSEERSVPAPATLVTWRDNVEAVVAARCATSGCHAAIAPSAGYDLTTYLGALGGGHDATPNAIAGDPGSEILSKLDGPDLDDLHAGFADMVPLLTAWVVDSQLAYRKSRVHDPGLLDPANPKFHGFEVRDRGWDFPLCQRCHGEDFSGGAAKTSCLTCHRNGPTACETCHGLVPSTNAHRKHVDAGVRCGDCHRVPARWDDPGHILDLNGKADPPPAEVSFGALANRDGVPPRRTMQASYDPETHRCSAVYCHGSVLGDPAATNTSPVWTGGAAEATCGSCHGKPPTSHAQSECTTCHPSTVKPDGTLTAQHVDGTIQIGDGSGPCTGCHGDATSAAPPRGLHGELFTTALAVGAHRAHLDAPNLLRGPIACTECHVVPAAVGDAGHIDSALPAEVFPIGAGVLARADGAAPVWDRISATCTSVYCHGGGTRLTVEDSPGRLRAPSWTASGGQVYCGSCHGVPPNDMFHAPTLTLGDCTTCHPSVDGFGNIVLTGPPGAVTSQHINGVVDVR